MKRDTALIAIIAVTLLVVAFQTIELIGLTDSIKTTAIKTTGLATARASQNTQSEYDLMMRQMHPDQVKQPAAAGQPIGGC